jgi:hypothetical protein
MLLLPFSLALGIAVAASYSLLVARPSPGSGAASLSAGGELVDAPQHHGEVDAVTQDQLMKILRAADSSEEP